jgi:hypothetical protein
MFTTATLPISTPALNISVGPFLESTEPGEWKETLAQSSVEVKYLLNFISTPQYDYTVWILNIQCGKFVLS